MFVAMNRFSVVPGQEDRFEEVWRGRDESVVLQHPGDVPALAAHLPAHVEQPIAVAHLLPQERCQPLRAREVARLVEHARGLRERREDEAVP